MKEDARQREHPLRELFNGLRWLARTGSPWPLMPHDLPPWLAVYQQTRRSVRAGCFETMAEDLRLVLRLVAKRQAAPSATILDNRTIQSTPESGGRADYDGAKKREGSEVHNAVDTLGYRLALKVAAANEQDRAQVEALARAVQHVNGDHVELGYVDQRYTGDTPAAAARRYGMKLEVFKHTEAKRGFVLLPRVGWWSARLPGPRDSAGWPGIMNHWVPHSPAITGSSSLFSCSNPSFQKVHDRLSSPPREIEVVCEQANQFAATLQHAG